MTFDSGNIVGIEGNIFLYPPSSITLNVAGWRQRLIGIPDVSYSQFSSELLENKPPLLA